MQVYPWLLLQTKLQWFQSKIVKGQLWLSEGERESGQEDSGRNSICSYSKVRQGLSEGHGVQSDILVLWEHLFSKAQPNCCCV